MTEITVRYIKDGETQEDYYYSSEWNKYSYKDGLLTIKFKNGLILTWNAKNPNVELIKIDRDSVSISERIGLTD